MSCKSDLLSRVTGVSPPKDPRRSGKEITMTQLNKVTDAATGTDTGAGTVTDADTVTVTGADTVTGAVTVTVTGKGKGKGKGKFTG